MFKNLDELKEFILWAQSKDIKSVKVGDIEVVTADTYFAKKIQDELYPSNSEPAKEIKSSSKTWTDDVDPAKDEDLLFHSSMG